ncbi:MAG: hypothetical protein HQ582_07880 [Planctomycetes bacterium]|nr:hypothetical protein [Planctomycetota bacterium]
MYLAIGWVVVVAFAVTFIITMLGLVEVIKIKPQYFQPLFYKMVIEIIAAGFFLFYAAFENEPPDPYIGEWSGVLTWDTTSDATRTSGTQLRANITRLMVTQTSAGNYSGVMYGRLRGPRNVFCSWVATNFVKDNADALRSFDIDFLDQPDREYGEILSVPYRLEFDAGGIRKLEGNVLLNQSRRNRKQVGTVLLEAI